MDFEAHNSAVFSRRNGFDGSMDNDTTWVIWATAFEVSIFERNALLIGAAYHGHHGHTEIPEARRGTIFLVQEDPLQKPLKDTQIFPFSSSFLFCP